MLKKLLAILAMFYAFAAFAAVDVNTATAADLDSIKGIGPGLSGKIVDERKKGQFKDWNDLIGRVKGVGEKNAVKFSTNGMTVNGATFAGAPAKPAKGKAQAAAPAAQSAPAAAAASPAATTKTIPAIVTKPEAAAPAAAPATGAAKPAAPATKQ